MAEQQTHELEIVATSMEELRAVLGIAVDLTEGTQASLAEGATLSVSEISKSSGFEATTVLLTGVVSMLASTSSALLTEWLKNKLAKRRHDEPRARALTVFVDGQKIEIP